MKKTVTLNILAEDIKLNNYMNSNECPVTRALKRAGIDARHGGVRIVGGDRFNPIELATYQSVGFAKMNDKLHYEYELMSIYKKEPRDFTVDVELNLPE